MEDDKFFGEYLYLNQTSPSFFGVIGNLEFYVGCSDESNLMINRKNGGSSGTVAELLIANLSSAYSSLSAQITF